jgi:hypothetical protein
MLKQRALGLYRGPGQLAMAGHWSIEVLIRLPSQPKPVDVYFRPIILY